MHIPSSTYRLQFHKDFTFRHLEGIVDYLHQLGVTTLYASPVFHSTPGSMHGYDVIDPHTIDPEIGTLDELRRLHVKLQEKGMHWIQDIVPNHMAFNTRNTRLMDVLERGIDSPYYHYFDIDWDHALPELNGKLGVPFLGSELDTCISNGEIKISFSEKGFTVDYFETSYPLSVGAYPCILKRDTFETELNEVDEQAAALADLALWNSFREDWSKRLARAFGHAIKETLAEINASPDALKKVLNDQYYTLRYWKTSDREINYRRFFTVNELICLRMEDDLVFQEYHHFIHALYREGLIQGIRIDHIDGLHDPLAYLKNLRKLFGEECYVIAEKILEAKEDIPGHWPLEGTSGYEFLSTVSQLITDKSGAKKLVGFYRELVRAVAPYDELVFENKKMILRNYMQGEWENLMSYFGKLGFGGNLEAAKLKEALALIMVCLPVYRLYPDTVPPRGKDLTLMTETFEKALKQAPDLARELEHFRMLLLETPREKDHQRRVLTFLKRMMQFTGPLTAKGVEDTTFYVYNPLISHDEVGDAPTMLGITIQAFHDKMQHRHAATPQSLNATATHDTKRGEDARMRLNVISEFPEVWMDYVRQWLEMNAPLRTNVNGKTAPEINDEYFIYQSIVGGFPDNFQVDEHWKSRVREFLVKAIREAKVNSSWADPDEAYENACLNFFSALVDQHHGFLNSLVPFMEMVSRYASLYSIVQVLIKVTAPGIPDIYQGCELWDLSFVDPDNRRPVDYDRRKEMLQQIVRLEREGKLPLFHYLKINRLQGAEKLFVTWKALNFRKSMPQLFIEGSYIPLPVTGKQVVVMAFARRCQRHWAVVAIPLALARNREADQPYAADPDDEKFITLPEGAPAAWKNIFTGETLMVQNKISLFEAFKDFPVAVFVNSTDQASA